MFTKANNKALRILSIISALCITWFFTSCSANSQHNAKSQSSASAASQSNANSQPKVKTQSGTGFVTIRTDSFSLSVPKSWNTKTTPEVTFNIGKTYIGGISVIGYDQATQPVSQLYGNNAEAISQKKRNDLSLPSLEVMLRRTSPATASEQTSVNELHYYFIDKNKKTVYDLNFDFQQVGKETSEK